MTEHLEGIAAGPPLGTRTLFWSVLLFSSSILLLIPLIPTKFALLLVVAWVALMWVAISFIRSHFDYIVLAWLIVYPYCYYFFSFPRERSVFTLDRALFILILLEIGIASHQRSFPAITRDIRVSGYIWVAYLFVCVISLWGIPVADVLGSYRLLLDGMLMPAVFGFYGMRLFPIIRNLRKFHACLCVLMLSIAVFTTTELLTGTNLLPWPGAVEAWVQTSHFRIIRVDGPFENSGVLCLVGTLGFFFIMYARQLLAVGLTRNQQVLHKVGIASSLAFALMPMNRGLIVALLVCAGIDYCAKQPLVSRSLWNIFFALVIGALLFARIFYPAVYEDRVSRPDNFYQRIAQDQQTLEVARDHPLTGVGFNLYHDTVHGDPKYTAYLKGFEAMDYPHNSFFAVLAEEGSIGLILYLLAQLFLVRGMWRLRKYNRLGWQVFLYCVLVYTIYGLDVGMAYYSDLNLFYMILLGIIFQIQLHMVPGESNSN
jgi:O-Antigen ligase